MGSSSGESDQGIQGNVWSGFSLSQSTGSLGGGRADGSFPFLNFNGGHTINEPGSYEDFTYPSPFPSTSIPSAYQFSPQSPPHHSSTSTSSWLPSFFSSPPPLPPPPPNLPNSTSSSEPAPLLDQTEQSLFQTFLTTLDIDPQFLFNPVLPPGMPSPPSSNMLPSNQEQYEKEGKEREVLGREVGGLELGDQAQYGREGGGGLPGNLRQNSSRDTVLPTSPPRRRPSNSIPHADYSTTTTNLERPPINSSKKQRVSLPPLPSHSTDQITYEDTLMSPTSSHSPEPSGSDSDYSESFSVSKPTSVPKRSKRSRPVSNQPSRRNSLSSQSESTTISTAAPTKRKPKPDSQPPLIIPTSIPLQPATLTASEKRSNHIQSEQRRRNAIKLGFKDLVELVISGEKLSKIVLGSSSSLPESEDEDNLGGGKKKGKGGKKGGKVASGRGRGRKGDTGANAPKPPSAASYSSNSSFAGGGGESASSSEIVIKQDVLDRLKGSLSPAISWANRRPSFSSSRSLSSISSCNTYSPTESIAQKSNASLVDSLDLSSALSDFLTYYLDFYLPYTDFYPYFPSTTPLPSSIPFEIVSTPDSSPTSTRFSCSTLKKTSKCIWIRAPALLPSFGHLSLKQQKEAKKQTIPAFPALFDKAEKQKVINLDGDFWQFEKLGPELDQSFWHLRLKGHEDIVVKVVFDQAYGVVGR